MDICHEIFEFGITLVVVDDESMFGFKDIYAA